VLRREAVEHLADLIGEPEHLGPGLGYAADDRGHSVHFPLDLQHPFLGEVIEEAIDVPAGDAQQRVELRLLALPEQIGGTEELAVALQHPVDDVIAAESPAIFVNGDGEQPFLLAGREIVAEDALQPRVELDPVDVRGADPQPGTVLLPGNKAIDLLEQATRHAPGLEPQVLDQRPDRASST
jgi:hypothetical protein